MLAKNIRYLRKSRSMSQEELADKLGYKSYTTIQKWESGDSEPPMNKFKAVSELFGYDMDTIANYDIELAESGSQKKSDIDEAINTSTIQKIQEDESSFESSKLLSKSQQDLLDSFDKLNDEGQKELQKLADLLVASRAYEDKKTDSEEFGEFSQELA